MQFRTQIPLKPKEPKIDYDSGIFLAGSCFVENIGEKLDFYKFRQLKNPFGILFHPFAIENFLARVASGYNYSEKDIFFHNESWHCFEAHSALNKPGKEEILEVLNNQIQQTVGFLKTATHVIITPGTAWSYRFKETDTTVANCHKIPQKNFSKELASTNDVEKSLRKAVSAVKNLNPSAQVIFTVSPVRHLKDGFIENQRSKANLISGIHEVIAEDPETHHYFPSYEIMMDELRDYRFYSEDMLHPSDVAIDYIWKRFMETWISTKAQSVLKEVEEIQKGLSHRAFNPDSTAHKNFQKKIEEKIKVLEKTFPDFKF